jgi:hypothetical protein
MEQRPFLSSSFLTFYTVILFQNKPHFCSVGMSLSAAGLALLPPAAAAAAEQTQSQKAFEKCAACKVYIQFVS